MRPMRLKVLPVPPQQSGVSLTHQQVLCVPLLGRFGEIERTYHQCGPIDQHHLIVRNRVCGVNEDRDPGDQMMANVQHGLDGKIKESALRDRKPCYPS